MKAINSYTKTKTELVDLEREEEYEELCKPGKVTTYKLNKEELLKKYGEVNTETKRRNFSLMGNERIRMKEGESVVFGVDRVKKDILQGLTKEDVYEKYEVANNVKSRMFNMAVKQLLNDEEITEEQAEDIRKSKKGLGDKEMTIGEVIEAKKEQVKEVEEVEEAKEVEVKEVEEVEEVKKEQESRDVFTKKNTGYGKLELKKIELEGKVLSYSIIGNSLGLNKGNHFLNINIKRVDELIEELEELKEYIK